MGKEPACNAGDTGDVGLILGSGRPAGEGHGNPFQSYGLENPMGRGAWRAMVHGVTKSQTRLSDKHFLVKSYLNNCSINPCELINMERIKERVEHQND